MDGLFFDLTLLLGLAAGFGLVMHLLRQPPLLGYILTGILIGSFGILGRAEQEVFQSLADIGIALLLFMVGLEMNIRDLKSVGLVSLLTGIGQIVFTTVFGVMIARAFGYPLVTATYIALALAFSSTIIVVKLLSQKQDLGTLYGKIAVGFLLVQDFIAILTLVVLSGFNLTGGTLLDWTDLAIVISKAVVLVATIIVLSQTLIPYLVDRVAKSQELLFVTSLAWAFAIAAFTASPLIGFSVEIGGFLAGLALANAHEHLQIGSRIRPLRDFFIVLFFALLGMQLGFGNIGDIWPQAIIFSLFVLVGDPLIVIILMGLLGFRRRTSFLTGLTMAQISEFSLILVALGVKLGHLTPEILTLITLVAIITMPLSAYMILESDTLYRWVRPFLKFFERKKTIEGDLALPGPLADHTVIIGGHRTAENILKALDTREGNLVVVDYNPSVVEELVKVNIPVIFGDISDPDIAEQAGLEQAKLIVSTVTDPADTRRLLSGLRKRRRDVHIIVTAQEVGEAKEFYELGADYVLLPHFVSGEHLADIITDKSFSTRLERLKSRHLKALTAKQ